MQYHYVIAYDSETKSWFIEGDSTAYFSDGHVWDEDQYRKEGWGWTIPEDGSDEEALDKDLFDTLQCLLDVIPIPKEHQSA